MRCSHCHTNFSPKRSDAKYCSNPCREAAYHKRKKVSDRASAAAVAEERKAEGLRVIAQVDAIQFIATMLRAQAKLLGFDVKFAPAPTGVIAVEGRLGAFDEAADTMMAGHPYLTRCEGRISTDDAQAMISSLEGGGSIIAREARAEAHEAVARGGNVYELRPRADYIANRNRAAAIRNDGAKFLGLRGTRCRCGASWAGRDGWSCCGEPFDIANPDEPHGFPHPRGATLLRINRSSA
jgi:hypothetical protein